jgi:hypothetical protein
MLLTVGSDIGPRRTKARETRKDQEKGLQGDVMSAGATTTVETALTFDPRGKAKAARVSTN